MSGERAWWRWLAAVVVTAGVLVRVWPWLVAPCLNWEDGSLLFARCYDEFHLSDWGQRYAGYVPFASNVAASLLCRLPTHWIPTAFVAGAAMFWVFAATAILSAGWRTILPLRVRVMVAIVIAWMPVASHLELTMLAYAQWAVLWWLFVVLFEPSESPKLHRSEWWRLAAIAVLAVSHPLCALLVPLAYWQLWPGSHRARAHALLLAVFVHFCWVKFELGPGTEAPQLYGVAGGWEFLRIVVVRVMFEGLAGQAARMWLQQQGAVWLISGVLVSSVVSLACWRMGWQRASHPVRRFVTLLLVFAVATVTVAVMVRGACRYDDPWCVRYFGFARSAWIVSLLVLLAQRWRWWQLTAGLLVLLLSMSIGNRDLHVHLGCDRQLQPFLEELERQRLVRGGRTWIRARCRRDGQPPIVIRPH